MCPTPTLIASILTSTPHLLAGRTQPNVLRLCWSIPARSTPGLDSSQLQKRIYHIAFSPFNQSAECYPTSIDSGWRYLRKTHGHIVSCRNASVKLPVDLPAVLVQRIQGGREGPGRHVRSVLFPVRDGGVRVSIIGHHSRGRLCTRLFLWTEGHSPPWIEKKKTA